MKDIPKQYKAGIVITIKEQIKSCKVCEYDYRTLSELPCFGCSNFDKFKDKALSDMQSEKEGKG